MGGLASPDHPSILQKGEQHKINPIFWYYFEVEIRNGEEGWF